MSESPAEPSQARGKDFTEIPAPEWLISFGWLAAVVVGQGMVFLWLVMARDSGAIGDRVVWLRLVIGVVCGQVTSLAFFGVAGPGLLFWRLAGALAGMCLIAALAQEMLASPLVPMVLVAAHALAVTLGMTAAMTALHYYQRTFSSSGQYPPLVLSQFSLSQLLGLITFVALLSAIFVNQVLGRVEALRDAWLDHAAQFARSNATVGCALAISFVALQDLWKRLAFAAGFLLVLTLSEPWMAWSLDDRSGPYVHLLRASFLQNFAQFAVVLATILGLEQAGIQWQRPFREISETPDGIDTSADQKSA